MPRSFNLLENQEIINLMFYKSMQKNREMEHPKMFSASCRRLLMVGIGILIWIMLTPPLVFGQQNGKLISLKLDKVTVLDAIKEINRLSGNSVSYKREELEKEARQVSLELKDVQAIKAVEAVLQGTRLVAIAQGEIILIVPRKDNTSAKKSVRVKGFVYDTKKQPLSGVTVKLVGTSVGTATDVNGRFSLELLVTKGQLEFSFVGFQNQIISFSEETAKDTLRVIMREDVKTIEEVVVTGYATIDRSRYVGAVTQLRAEEIQVAGESTIDQMLQGWVPGMSVINKTGKVGGTPKIRIRGTSTLLGNQEPLWVVDGVIQANPLPLPDDASPLSSEMESLQETVGNAISWLNPHDIETITVLKDASATAIYGTQAANGVIVITTKKAKGEGFSISYNGSISVGQKPSYRMYDMMNSQEYMQFSQELWEDRESYRLDVLPIAYAGLIQKLQGKEISREQFEQEFRKMENMNTDWFDILFKNNFSHNHNVSISSNGKKLSSRFSMGVNRTLGEAKGNNMSGFTVSSNTTFRQEDRFSLDFQLNGGYRTTENFAFGVSPYDYAMNTTRAIPVRDENGGLYYHEKSGSTSWSILDKYAYNYNIINEMDNTGTETDGINLQAALNIRLNLLKDLEWQVGGSYSLASNKVKSWATEYSYYIANIRGYEVGEVLPNSVEQHASILPFGGLLRQEHGQNNNYSFRTSLVYDKVFGVQHKLIANIGFEVNSTNMEGSANMRYGYLYYRGEKFATVPKSVTAVDGLRENTNDLHENMRAGSTVTTTTSNTLSEYLTLVYSYQQRYVLNFNARLDASNRFGQDENKKFNPSWSLGMKWRIGNEPFMAWASSWYDMFDVSFSYGWRGNAVQAVSPYMIASDGGLDSYFQQYTLKLKSLPYPNLGWEKTEDWNLGIDFSFFQGRVSAGLSFYNKISRVLASRNVVIENGVENAYVDGTKMKNKGYELYVSVTPVKTKDFSWSLSFNTSKVKNSIRENERVNTRLDYIQGNAIVENEKYQTFYAYAFEGLDAENGRPLFKYMDVEDTENDLDYLVKVGCREPDITGGISTSLRYRKWCLRANFAMSFGAKTFLPTFFAASGAPAPERNAPRYLFKRWRKPGDENITNIPSIPAGNPNSMSTTLPTGEKLNPYDMYNQSDLRVAKTDFIRCRMISLHYYLPSGWLKKIGIRQSSFSLSLSNPFFIAFDEKWDGRDPETANWPARRTASCSLSFSF